MWSIFVACACSLIVARAAASKLDDVDVMLESARYFGETADVNANGDARTFTDYARDFHARTK
jgi:hypothetical protein